MAFPNPNPQARRTRRPLTDTQRNILQRERSERRLQAEEHARQQQRDLEQEARFGRERIVEAGIAQHSRVSTARALGAEQRRQRVLGGIQTAAAQPIKPFGSIFFTVLFGTAALIIFYDLVAHPEPTSTLLNTAGNWIHAIASPTSLFQKVEQ